MRHNHPDGISVPYCSACDAAEAKFRRDHDPAVQAQRRRQNETRAEALRRGLTRAQADRAASYAADLGMEEAITRVI